MLHFVTQAPTNCHCHILGIFVYSTTKDKFVGWCLLWKIKLVMNVDYLTCVSDLQLEQAVWILMANTQNNIKEQQSFGVNPP